VLTLPALCVYRRAPGYHRTKPLCDPTTATFCRARGSSRFKSCGPRKTATLITRVRPSGAGVVANRSVSAILPTDGWVDGKTVQNRSFSPQLSRPQMHIARGVGALNLRCDMMRVALSAATFFSPKAVRGSHNHDTPVVPIRRGNQARPSAIRTAPPYSTPDPPLSLLGPDAQRSARLSSHNVVLDEVLPGHLSEGS
jgi:hypothetical protein